MTSLKTSSSFSTKQKLSKENSEEDPNDSKEEKKRNLEDQSATESTKPQKKMRTELQQDFPSPEINDEGLLEWDLSCKSVCGST